MSVLCLKIRGYLSADIQQDLFETTHARPRGHAAATEVGSVKPAVQHPVRHYPNRPPPTTLVADTLPGYSRRYFSRNSLGNIPNWEWKHLAK